MSAWAFAFWLWVALAIGFVMGWWVRTALRPQDYPKLDPLEHVHIHTK